MTYRELDVDDGFVVVREVSADGGTSVSTIAFWTSAVVWSVNFWLAPSWEDAVVSLVVGAAFSFVVVVVLFLWLRALAKKHGWKRP